MSGIDRLKENASRYDMNTNEERTVVDLTSKFPEEKDENIRESFAKDILEGEDSPFEKYKKEKIEEMNERMAVYEDEVEIDQDDEEEDDNDEEDVLSFNEFGGEEEKEDIESFSVETETINKEEPVEESTVNTVDVHPIIESEEKINDTENVVYPEVEKVEEQETVEDVSVTNIDNTTEEVEIIEDDEAEVDVDEDEVLENLKKLATEKLKPTAQNLDISSFTVLKKPTANLKSLKTKQLRAAKWVLPTQESIVLMKEFSGSELESLREFSEDTKSASMLFRKYRCIYDHIVSAKPASYEAWLKSTPFADIDHYFFAAYIASFKGSNYLPLDCADKKCGKTFLSDDVPFMRMVKFNSDKSKEKFNELYESEQDTAGKGLYCSEIVPLNSEVAIGFKDASIYNLLEISTLDDTTKTKYSNIIEYIPYIDALYIIHPESQSLEPVGYKVYPENATKTIKSKIKKFNDVLKTLSVDEFGQIRPFISSIRTRVNDISYMYPSVDCPNCGKPTEETPMSAESMLFLRAQLSALVNTSLK